MLKTFSAVFFAAFFLALPPLWAQYGGDGYGERGGPPSFSQRLLWTGGEHAMHFEIVIEAEDEGGFSLVASEVTGEQYVIVALPPGRFRARVTPYDYLSRPGEPSQWMSFLVIPFPEGGQDILLAAEPQEYDYPPYSVYEDERDEFFAEEPYVDEGEGLLLSAAGSQDGGDALYDVYAGEGGFEAVSEDGQNFQDGGMFLRLGWMPVFVVYGSGAGVFFGDSSTLSGGGLRFGALTRRRGGFFRHGAEIALHAFSLDHALGGGSYLMLDINFLAQRRVFDGFAALTLRAGGGYAWHLGERGAALLNTGLSFMFFPWDAPFLFEAALDFSHFFSYPHSGVLRPWLGFGMRF